MNQILKVNMQIDDPLSSRNVLVNDNSTQSEFTVIDVPNIQLPFLDSFLSKTVCTLDIYSQKIGGLQTTINSLGEQKACNMQLKHDYNLLTLSHDLIKSEFDHLNQKYDECLQILNSLKSEHTQKSKNFDSLMREKDLECKDAFDELEITKERYIQCIELQIPGLSSQLECAISQVDLLKFQYTEAINTIAQYEQDISLLNNERGDTNKMFELEKQVSVQLYKDIDSQSQEMFRLNHLITENE